MGSTGIYLWVDKELLERFTGVARALGMSRSEAVRMATDMFIAVNEEGIMTRR